ncbi:MAG: stimulus-sensing domain-containing protein [Pseudomonadota bacterium]
MSKHAETSVSPPAGQSASAGMLKPGWGLFRSRTARRILASNIAGLLILVIGALVLNELRAGLVIVKKQDLMRQAEVYANLLAEGAIYGRPQPGLDTELAQATIKSLNLPEILRAQVRTLDGETVADSFFLSEMVEVQALPPVQKPGLYNRIGTNLSNMAGRFYERIMPERGSGAVRTQTLNDEYKAARAGEAAASQRFSDRGQRVVSVSIPLQEVSEIVGVLTLEASDIEQIIRAERVALIPFITVAMLVALVTSGLLTYAIARPLRRLSIAADRVRTGSSDTLQLDALARRKDEIGYLAQSLDAMTDALVERIEANEQFAADVAHELKNPITSIRSAVETAAMVQDDPAAREKLRKVIESDVKRLDRLITDISNASRLEAEMTRTPRKRVAMDMLCREIVDTYQATLQPGDVDVVFRDETMHAGLRVQGRGGQLGQVVRNLIDNARSFSPAGSTVTVRLQQGRKGPLPMARVLVEDQGPGVPEDKLEKIFERFYTDRPAGAAFGNNSGLGLSIVRQIIETHRGTVHAENQEGGGARFVIELPAI